MLKIMFFLFAFYFALGSSELNVIPYWTNLARQETPKFLEISKKRITYEFSIDKAPPFLLETLNQIPSLLVLKKEFAEISIFIIDQLPPSYLAQQTYFTFMKQLNFKLRETGSLKTSSNVLNHYKNHLKNDIHSEAYLWTINTLAYTLYINGDKSSSKKIFDEQNLLIETEKDLDLVYAGKSSYAKFLISEGNISEAKKILSEINTDLMNSIPSRMVWTEILSNKILYLTGDSPLALKKSLALSKKITQAKLPSYLVYVNLDAALYARKNGDFQLASTLSQNALAHFENNPTKPLFLQIDLNLNSLKNKIIDKQWSNAEIELTRIESLLKNKELYSSYSPLIDLLKKVILTQTNAKNKPTQPLDFSFQESRLDATGLIDIKHLLKQLDLVTTEVPAGD